MRVTTSESKPFSAVAFALTVLLPIGACGGDDPGSSSRGGAEESASVGEPVPGGPTGSLTIARPQDVRDINPLRQANNATSEVTYQMHEGLVQPLTRSGIDRRIGHLDGSSSRTGSPIVCICARA